MKSDERHKKIHHLSTHTARTHGCGMVAHVGCFSLTFTHRAVRRGRDRLPITKTAADPHRPSHTRVRRRVDATTFKIRLRTRPIHGGEFLWVGRD